MPKYDPNAESTIEIVERMEIYGGSFVKKLAELFFRGDYNNRLKIVTTWQNYFDDYANMPDPIKPTPLRSEPPEKCYHTSYTKGCEYCRWELPF